MQEVKVLGISGSPRRGANTAILVKKALEGASSVPGVKTEFYEMAGKKFHHCIGCLKCHDKGECVFKDDLVACLDAPSCLHPPCVFVLPDRES